MPAIAGPRLDHSLRSGPSADPHRDVVAGRVAAPALFARALIALGPGITWPPPADVFASRRVQGRVR